MDNNDLERHRVLPFPNGSPLYILIWASQSAHSKSGGTNCLDCDHSRPIVGQQQVFTAGTYLARHSDAQGCFFASLKATTIGGSCPKGVLKAAQHFLPAAPSILRRRPSR